MAEKIFLDDFRGELPFNLEAEQSVLGAILVDSQCINTVLEYISSPDCFYKEAHKKLFSVMCVMNASMQPIDFVTVLENAMREKVFESESDGKLYLTQLIQLVPTASNVEAYAKIVREKHYLRMLVSASGEIIEQSKGGYVDADMMLETAEQKIYEIRQGRQRTGLIKIDELMIQAYDTLQKLSGTEKDEYLGISTGFSQLDKILSGLNKSDLILIAARPAMGKTSFALNIATNAAKKSGKNVAIFSLEMSGEQLVNRILSSEASVSGMKMRTGDMDPEEWLRLASASAEIGTLPIYIDDTSGITVNEMKAKLRRLPNLGLVVIDYLQLMQSGKRNDGNRVQEVSEITRSLKIMAKELNVPVICLSQLSRGPESRQDHRPMLSDLRESGSIEQDADIVMFLYRDAYYNPDTENVNLSECIVAKNRHGEVKTAALGWDDRFTRFTNLEFYRDEQ